MVQSGRGERPPPSYAPGRLSRGPQPGERRPGRAGSRGPVFLAEAEDELGILRHTLGRPRRVERQLRLNLAYAGNLAHDALNLFLNHRPNRAPHRRERKRDLDVLTVNGSVIEESELNDVHPEFGIFHLAERFDDFVFRRHTPRVSHTSGPAQSWVSARRSAPHFAPMMRSTAGYRSVSTVLRCPSRLVRWQAVPLETPMFQAFRGAEPPHFVNEAELEYAKLLDYYGVPWMYEPHTFVLARDEDGRVTEAFTPDFYLPEQDLYLEVTVMKQSLVTRKNRKVRRLRELHPEIKIKLFYERDFARLASRYGLRQAS